MVDSETLLLRCYHIIPIPISFTTAVYIFIQTPVLRIYREILDTTINTITCSYLIYTFLKDTCLSMFDHVYIHIFRRNAMCYIVAYSHRWLLRVSLCAYAALVDSTNTVWDISAFFHHLVEHTKHHPTIFLAMHAFDCFLTVKDSNRDHFGRLDVVIS